jgi:flavin reductase (DIM6/NTAB) family NADH-FMN oxidoreductase RutF
MNDISQMITDGCLITAGNIEKFNTMTIGWGMLGTIWRKDTFMCFVRPSRYTYEFMEKNEYFTVSFYYPSKKRQLSILGTKSGRNTDKVKEVGFTPIPCEDSVTFKEAYMTLLCKKIYFQDMDSSHFPESVSKIYYSTNDVHRLYFGEIIKVINQDEDL